MSDERQDLVLVERYDGYAVVTFNRPEKRNAMSTAAQRQFRAALEATHDVRVVVITGIGTAFCAGVDLKEEAELVASRKPVKSHEVPYWTECQEEIARHPAVFIAAVNGFALGGGSTLVNNCELAIAAESATIGVPELGFATWPTQSGPAMVKRVLPKHAAELIFNAKRVDAATAFRMGLVNEVVPDEYLLERAIEMAQHIAAFDADILDWGKKAYRAMLDLSWDAALDYSRYTSELSRARRGALHPNLAGFADGVRGPGQGAAGS